MNELEQKTIWSITDVCEYTGFKQAYIYQLTSKRRIPFYKPTGGKVFFKPAEVKDWLFNRSMTMMSELKQQAQTRLSNLPNF